MVTAPETTADWAKSSSRQRTVTAERLKHAMRTPMEVGRAGAGAAASWSRTSVASTSVALCPALERADVMDQVG